MEGGTYSVFEVCSIVNKLNQTSAAFRLHSRRLAFQQFYVTILRYATENGKFVNDRVDHAACRASV